MLPSKKELKLARAMAWRLSQLPKEKKGDIHYGVFLLCFGAGLRVSEAISFDLNKQWSDSNEVSDSKQEKGFFVVQSKNHQERKVAVNQSIVQELKANNWQPNQTNRFNFVNFCQRVKKEANLAHEVELTPHTGRRAWATYQAENGVPLPVLSKMLGHKQLETTAQYYWKGIYSPEEIEQIQLATKTEILNSVKDKRYWREYNANRKEYLREKNQERYSKQRNKKNGTKCNQQSKLDQKAVKKSLNKLASLGENIAPSVAFGYSGTMLKNRGIFRKQNTTTNTIYACQELPNPFKSAGPPKSRFEMSR